MTAPEQARDTGGLPDVLLSCGWPQSFHEQARDTGGLLLAQAMYETEPNTRADDTNEPADWTYASGFAIDLYTRWAARVTERLRALSQGAAHEERGLDVEPMHEALMTVYGECHHGEGAADCTTVVAAYLAATPEAAPISDQ